MIQKGTGWCHSASAVGVDLADRSYLHPMVRGQALARLLSATADKLRILKYVACFLIPHCLQELLTNGRMFSDGLRQRPLTPLFDFFEQCTSLLGSHSVFLFIETMCPEFPVTSYGPVNRCAPDSILMSVRNNVPQRSH